MKDLNNEKIRVFTIKNFGILVMPLKRNKIFFAKAFLGQNGVTKNKKEGDKKTPIGTYKLGLCFGTHSKEDMVKLNKKFDSKISYIELNDNYYWISDSCSKYYNELVDINKLNRNEINNINLNNSEHLIDYKKEYEYAIEIKYNEEKIPGKGSAIFLHCTNKKYTSGCIAISRRKMLKLLKNLEENVIISIYKL